MEIIGNFIALLLYLNFLSGCIETSESYSSLPLWSWHCVEEKCVPFKALEETLIQSLETCSMLCTALPLWPQPTGPISLATTAVATRADLFVLEKLNAPSKVAKDHVKDLFDLFKKDLHVMEHNLKVFAEWYNVQVEIYINKSGDPRMRQDTDESYMLDLASMGTRNSLSAKIMANSFCGARHGLETLTQLVWLDPSAGTLMILHAASIEDAPKFRYRGLMIDTASSYLPASALIRTIDAMAISKLNTFHWHVSDSQAFSLQLNTVPQLAMYGAYSQRDVYQPETVRAIARRARLRGIRVIIEVDSPAHVGHAWDWGPTLQLGELVQCIDHGSGSSWVDYCRMPPCGQLNPTNNHVLDILQRVYAEIIQLTAVDDIFHIGGSEISTKCWKEHSSTDADPTDIWIKFTKAALRRLESISGTLPNLTIFWTSSLTKHMKKELKDYVHAIGLQLRSTKDKHHVSGLRTILSHEESWDLNSGFGQWYDENGGTMFNSWQRVYEHRPWVRNKLGVVEGGEATVWSWGLTAGDIDSRIWPRAAALGERLWADRPEGPTKPVTARLDYHRSRLVSRGIKAAPLWSLWCSQNTYTCS